MVYLQGFENFPGMIRIGFALGIAVKILFYAEINLIYILINLLSPLKLKIAEINSA